MQLCGAHWAISQSTSSPPQLHLQALPACLLQGGMQFRCPLWLIDSFLVHKPGCVLYPCGACRSWAKLAVHPGTNGWAGFISLPYILLERPRTSFSNSFVTSDTDPPDRVGQVSCSPWPLPTLPHVVWLCFAFSGGGAAGADLFSSITLVIVVSELSERVLLDWKKERENICFSPCAGTGPGMSWMSEPTSCPL